jgi:hypothetical protein
MNEACIAIQPEGDVLVEHRRRKARRAVQPTSLVPSSSFSSCARNAACSLTSRSASFDCFATEAVPWNLVRPRLFSLNDVVR